MDYYIRLARLLAPLKSNARLALKNIHTPAQARMVLALAQEVRRRPGEAFWSDHFMRQALELRGRTPHARATIALLNINHPDYLAVRESLIAERSFPPPSR